ncbi:DsbA family protein [Brevibacterium renqingii]|uniref:DsbA family protein n=1 Tax=Brevibacterium renqingii TaxID=2776916 RepID=UPI0031B627F8
MLRTERGPMFWLIPVAVIILATVLIGIVIANQGGSDADAQGQSSSSQTDSSGDDVDLSFVEHRDSEEMSAIGDVDAPVTLVMYSDYQCPYCAAWNEDTLPAMMEYVDSGDLRIEMRDLAVFGEESERAARAVFAAGKQDEYWEYHNALFEGGEHRPKSQLDDDSLVSLGEDLGLDPLQFKQDMNSVEAHEEFDAVAAEGQSIGVSSTPAFVIGGKPLLGAQPTQEFTDAVDEALARAEG